MMMLLLQRNQGMLPPDDAPATKKIEEFLSCYKEIEEFLSGSCNKEIEEFLLLMKLLRQRNRETTPPDDALAAVPCASPAPGAPNCFYNSCCCCR